MTVKADDDNGGTDTIDVTITVTDVNEAPAFPGPSETGSRSIPEKTRRPIPEHWRPGRGHRPGRWQYPDLHAGRDGCGVL